MTYAEDIARGAEHLGVSQRTFQQMARPTITTPDGRTFRGQYPHLLGQYGEAPYIASFAKAVGGICEVTLPAGRADVATRRLVCEVEPVKSWRHGAQQAYAYAAMTGLKATLALFGPADYLRIYQTVRSRMPGLDLWAWCGGDHWEELGSRRVASRKMPWRDAVPLTVEGR